MQCLHHRLFSPDPYPGLPVSCYIKHPLLSLMSYSVYGWYIGLHSLFLCSASLRQLASHSQTEVLLYKSLSEAHLQDMCLALPLQKPPGHNSTLSSVALLPPGVSAVKWHSHLAQNSTAGVKNSFLPGTLHIPLWAPCNSLDPYRSHIIWSKKAAFFPTCLMFCCCFIAISIMYFL